MKRHFFTGLIILLPLALSLAVLTFLVGAFTDPFVGIASIILSKLHLFDNGFFFWTRTQVIHFGSVLFILLTLFVLTLFLGAIANWFFGRRILAWSDAFLQKIPIVRTLYKVSYEVLKTLLSPDSPALKQVVLVPFPKAGTYVVGLIAREAPREFQVFSNEELISVLIPTTPNPTTAFLIMIPRSKVIPVDVRAEDALKFVVSCGLIFPPEKAPQ